MPECLRNRNEQGLFSCVFFLLRNFFLWCSAPVLNFQAPLLPGSAATWELEFTQQKSGDLANFGLAGLRSTEILLWFGAQPPEEEAREGEWGRDVFLTLPPESLWVTLGRIAELRPHLYLFLSVFICGIKAKSFTVLRIVSNPPNITMKAGNNGRSKNQF